MTVTEQKKKIQELQAEIQKGEETRRQIAENLKVQQKLDAERSRADHSDYAPDEPETEIKAENQRMKEEIKGLNRTLSEKQLEMRELRDERQQDQKTMITMTNEKGSIQQQYRQLNSEKDELIAERDRLIAAKEELAALVRQQQNTVAFLSEGKDRGEQLRRELEEEKEELSAECQRQREIVVALKDKMKEQMTAMDIIQSEKDEIEQRYESTVTEKEEMENKLRQQIQVQQQENAQLKEDLEKTRLEQEVSKEQYKAVVSERDSLRKEFKAYNEWQRTRVRNRTNFNLSQRTNVQRGSQTATMTSWKIETSEKEMLKLRYNIEWESILGRGSFGAVFEAEDKLTNKNVAVKTVILSQIPNRDPQEVLRILRTEHILMTRCHHKNIVKLLEYYEKGLEKVYFVVELCAGGSLRKLLNEEGPLNELDAQSFTMQITKALLYLKSMEISHRDLKPANILLTKNSADAVIKLADFGTAAFKVYDENGNTIYKTHAGTECYMAPEVLAKEQVIYGSNVDLWSLGVIIYEMITNKLPFQKENGKSLLDVMLSEIVNLKEVNINDDGKQLLIGLLKANSKERRWDIIDFQKPSCSKWLQKQQVQKRQVMQGIETSFIKEEEFANEMVLRWRQHTFSNLHDDIVEELSDKYEDLEGDEDSDSNNDSKENGDGEKETKSKFELLMDRVASEFLFGVLMESMKAMKERKSRICQMIAKPLQVQGNVDPTAVQMIATTSHPLLQRRWKYYFKSKMENQYQIDISDVDTVVDGVYNVVIDKEPYSSWQFLNENKLKKYIKECAEICWIMILMKPELSFHPAAFRAIYDDKKEDHRYDEKEKHDLWEGSKTKNAAKTIYFSVPAISQRHLVDKEKSLQVLPGQLFAHNDESVVKYIMSDPDELMRRKDTSPDTTPDAPM